MIEIEPYIRVRIEQKKSSKKSQKASDVYSHSAYMSANLLRELTELVTVADVVNDQTKHYIYENERYKEVTKLELKEFITKFVPVCFTTLQELDDALEFWIIFGKIVRLDSLTNEERKMLNIGC